MYVCVCGGGVGGCMRVCVRAYFVSVCVCVYVPVSVCVRVRICVGLSAVDLRARGCACAGARALICVFECVHAYMWVFEEGIAGKRAHEELARLARRLNGLDKLRSAERSRTYQRCKTVG